MWGLVWYNRWFIQTVTVPKEEIATKILDLKQVAKELDPAKKQIIKAFISEIKTLFSTWKLQKEAIYRIWEITNCNDISNKINIEINEICNKIRQLWISDDFIFEIYSHLLYYLQYDKQTLPYENQIYMKYNEYTNSFISNTEKTIWLKNEFRIEFYEICEKHNIKSKDREKIKKHILLWIYEIRQFSKQIMPHIARERKQLYDYYQKILDIINDKSPDFII